jgi:tetratricopeptide (TPR) repeat protein
MARWTGWWPILLGLAVALGFLTWLFPYGASAYHLEKGGRTLEQTAHSSDHPNPDILAESVAHLEAALYWQEDSAHACRLLGRAHLFRGDLTKAAEALVRYTSLQPRNPQGWQELARIYEAMESLLEVAPGANLMERLAEIPSETGEVGEDVPHRLREVPLSSHASTLTEWEMPLAAASQPASLEVLGWAVNRRVLPMHPPAQVRMDVTVPNTAVILTFWMGVDPAVWGLIEGGLVFGLAVDGEKVFSHYLGAEEARQGWWPGQVDLNPWGGRQVSLTMTIDPGPGGTRQGNWAGWGDVQMFKSPGAQYAVVAPLERTVAAWRAGGFTAQDAVSAGEAALKAKRYKEAREWIERAMRLEPGLGDPWYYMGLLYQDQEQWSDALDAYEHAIALGRFYQVGRSSPYYRLGTIYQRRLELPQPEKALVAYELALNADDFMADGEEVDCHYQRGIILWQIGSNPDDYLADFQQVVEQNPNHASGHVMLGVAYYVRFGDAARAVAEIQQGLQLFPQNKWAYYLLGEIYAQEGRVNESIMMYQQALEIDPGFESAQKRLAALRSDQ